MTVIALNCFSESDRKAIREQLDRIIRSGSFVQSPRRQRFLEYIINETLAGRGQRLKGYNIALEVFGRSETFDPAVDPIVRIEAGRIRERLRDYYRAEGQRDPIYIQLPKGTYTPKFEFREAASIVRALRPKMTPSETVCIGQQGTRNSDAHDELLRGLEQFWGYTRKSCAAAQHHFSQAVAYDPDYAAAHAWLARTFAFQFYMSWTPSFKSALALALRHARLAVELDGQSALAHAILALTLTHLKDGEDALMEGRRACAVDPSSADAKLFLSFILAVTGRRDEALRNIETAMLLQPYPSSLFFEVLGVCHFALGDYDRAIAAFVRGIEIKPTFIPCHYQLAVTYGVCGQTDAARSEAAIVKDDWPNISLDYFLHPRLEEIWLRGKEAAGLA